MSRLSSAGVEKVNVTIKNSGRNKTDRYWAEKALVSPETWNRFRTGKVRISDNSFISCCKVLDIDPNEVKKHNEIKKHNEVKKYNEVKKQTVEQPFEQPVE